MSSVGFRSAVHYTALAASPSLFIEASSCPGLFSSFITFFQRLFIYKLQQVLHYFIICLLRIKILIIRILNKITEDLVSVV
jgi:hypothetical protein